MKVSFVKSSVNISGILVIFVNDSKELGKFTKSIDKDSNGQLTKLIKSSGYKAKKGKTLEVFALKRSKIKKLVLIGLGKEKTIDKKIMQELGNKALNYLSKEEIKKAYFLLDVTFSSKELDSEMTSNLAFGAMLSSYRFYKYFSEDKKKNIPPNEIIIMGEDLIKTKKYWADLKAVAGGVFTTRNLVSEPANVMYPIKMSLEAKKLSKLGVQVEILTQEKLKNLKMNALLGVAQGSANEARVVAMRWKGKKSGDGRPDIAYVGKGVTFDTGGISINPSSGMEDMKWDMGGAGVVIGLMEALASRKAKIDVCAVIGLVENMPSGTAQRPGDVVKSMDGQTIEVINTDAEGRLVLADAIHYTQKKYKPKMLIDLATLTGAIIVSLGSERAGYFSNDDLLSNALYQAGEKVNEKVWRMPIDDAYDKDIDSKIADMKNVGSGRGAGSIAGAMFIKRFINNIPWAHIDIAGVTWSSKEKTNVPAGGTGFGVRLLDQFSRDLFEK